MFVQLDQLDKIFKVLGSFPVYFLDGSLFLLLYVAKLYHSLSLLHRPSHTWKVANTAKSSTLATRFATYTRAQVVSFFLSHFIKSGIKSEINVWGTCVHWPMVFGPSGISSRKGWRVRLRVQSHAGAGVVICLSKKKKICIYHIIGHFLGRVNLFVSYC